MSLVGAARSDALALAIENGHPSGRRRREPASRARPSIDAGARSSRGDRSPRACGRADRAPGLAVLARPRAASPRAARHRLGDGTLRAPRWRALARRWTTSRTGHARRSLRAQDALAARPRREGFLGEELSEAELRVLRAFASGASLGEVARELYLSPNTVKTHRRSIYRKLGVSTREQLLARAATLDLSRAQTPPTIAPGDARPRRASAAAPRAFVPDSARRQPCTPTETGCLATLFSTASPKVRACSSKSA